MLERSVPHACAFMKGAEEKKLRVDFIAVHWFDDTSEHNAPAKFMAYIKDLHTTGNTAMPRSQPK